MERKLAMSMSAQGIAEATAAVLTAKQDKMTQEMAIERAGIAKECSS